MLRGQRLDGRPPHRRDVGLVFQTYALFPHLTVFDNIAFGLRLRKVSKAEIERRVGQMLELVDLPNLAARYPAQLSGGQQQRVAIARSLVLEPSLLLFDEPLSNLDLKLRIQMRYELRDLQKRLGKTAVYVTHDQTEALALSDRIAVLSQGRIEQIGTPSEIYEWPASAFVADFIGSSNLLKACAAPARARRGETASARVDQEQQGDARHRPGRRDRPGHRSRGHPRPAAVGRTMERGRHFPYWAVFVGPYGAYLLVFLVLPFLNVALLSVYLHSPTKIAIAEFTATNYAKLWEVYYATLFLRTLRLALVVTVVCAVLGYPVAYFLARSTSRIMTLGLFLLIMPLLVSTVIRVFGWLVILGSEGLVNQGLRLLGARESVRLLYTEGAVIVGLVQQTMPFMVLPIMAAIERISPSLEEAARNLGANWGQMFVRTILPLSMPGLVSGSLLVFSVSMSAFVTPALMGGRRERMVGQQIYEEVLTAYNWPGAASLTIVLAVLMLALVCLALWAAGRRARLEIAAR